MKRAENGTMEPDELDKKILESLTEGPKSRQELLPLDSKDRNVQRRIETLLKYGYIERVRHGIYGLTAKGRAAAVPANSLSGPPLQDQKIKKLIGMLPTAVHRSLFRLTLDGIVAKYLLLDKYENGWPCSIIGGEGKEFKTGLAYTLCRLIDELDPGRNICAMQSSADKALTFRVTRGKGKGNYELDISSILSEPFMVFDEFDKASSKKLQNQASLFLDGRRAFTVESELVTNNAYPFITLNNDQYDFGIIDPYIRRSIVVDAKQLPEELRGIELVVEKICRLQESDTEAPRLSLKSLSPPETSFTQEDFHFLHHLFMNNVREGYEKLVDTKPIEILIMGRLVLLGSEDIKEATFAVVWDRLRCLETMQGTRDGWRERVEEAMCQHQKQIPAEFREGIDREQISRKKAQTQRELADKFDQEKSELSAEVAALQYGFPDDDALENRLLELEERLNSLLLDIKEAEGSEDLILCQQEKKAIQDEIFLVKAMLEKLKEKRAAVEKVLREVEQRVISYSMRTGKPVTNEKEHLDTLSTRIKQAGDLETLNGISSTLQQIKFDLNQKLTAFKTEEERKRTVRQEEERRKKESLQQKLEMRIEELKAKLAPYPSKTVKKITLLTSLETDVVLATHSTELLSIENNLEKNTAPQVEQLVAKLAREEEQKQLFARAEEEQEQLTNRINEDIEALTRVLERQVVDVPAELERRGLGWNRGSSGSFEDIDEVVYEFDLFWTEDLEGTEPLIKQRLKELRELKALIPKVKTLQELEELRERYEEPFRKIEERKRKGEE